MPTKGDYSQTVLKTSLKYRFLGHPPYLLNQSSQKKYKRPRHRCICKAPKVLLLIIEVWKGNPAQPSMASMAVLLLSAQQK